jgi:two-component system phosphate regulon sensor histidine kinase PhoR
MSLLFGLLVTVPLVISGIVLSLVGWRTVHESGNTVAEIGRAKLDETTGKFKDVARRNLEQTQASFSQTGKKSLEQIRQSTVKAGSAALQENAVKMSQRGQAAVTEATHAMAGVSRSSLEHSLVQFGHSSQKSLRLLKEDFSRRMERELQTNSSPVQERLKTSLLESWKLSADRRALSIEDYVKKVSLQVVQRLQYPLRTTEVVRGYPEEAAQTLEREVRKNFSPEIVRVVLVSSTGEEIARIPQTDRAEDWADSKSFTRRNFFAQRPPVPYLVEPIRWEKDEGKQTGRWVQRVVHQVDQGESGPDAAPAPPDPAAPEAAPMIRKPTSFIVVDLALTSAAELATSPGVLPRGMQVLVIRGPGEAGGESGQIISSTVPAQLNSVSQRILEKLPKGDEALKYRLDQKDAFNFEYLTQDNVLMQASARYWRPEDNCWTVVVQPNEVVLQPVTELEAGIRKAWTEALNKVQADGDRLIKLQIDQAAGTQKKLVLSAMQDMTRNEAHVKQTVAADFQKHQAALVKQLEGRLGKEAAGVQEKTGAEMDQQAGLLAKDAVFRFGQETGQATGVASREIEQRANRAANRAAGQMLLNSAWLIPLFLVLAFFLATMTARSLAKPIDQLVRGTQALATGDYHRRMEIRGDDELARLALAFNDMAGAISLGQAQLQQSHDSLAAEKARIEAIVECSPDGLIMLEPSGQIAFMNPTAMRLLDLPADSLPGAPFDFSQWPPPAAERFRECLERVHTGEGAQEYEVEEPERRVLQLREVRLCSQEGRSYGRLLHMHDITRERVIDEMKSDFISLVSHELRTPLTSILGFSSYMLTGKLGDVAEHQKMALESIHRQARRLSAIIADFLDISRIESGKIEMKKEPVTLPQVADRVVEDLRPQAAEKHVHVSTHLDPGPLPLVALGDEQRIAQVFTNLIGNALKFTEQDGSVDVRLSRQNGEVVCRVRDTGCGIPPDELDRVFDRFYQVEKVVTRKSGGTGLGLAIVKNIVEAHGGRIWIESEVGQGTEVSFTLPGSG